MSSAKSLLDVKHVKMVFPLPGKKSFTAVDDVSFSLELGETLGIVGESGCGKSSLARTLLRLIEPQQGEIWICGENILTADRQALQKLRRQIQMVFQDPFASLDPRQTIGGAIMEPMRIYQLHSKAAAYDQHCCRLLDTVGINPKLRGRFPHEFSGGQLQRVAIARALALSPKILVADEPVSALDVSIQAQIINLLKDLQRELGLGLVFISHDLSVVRFLAHKIAVMNHGQFVEYGLAEQVCCEPVHPYTRALISSIPNPDPAKKIAYTSEPRMDPSL